MNTCNINTHVGDRFSSSAVKAHKNVKIISVYKMTAITSCIKPAKSSCSSWKHAYDVAQNSKKLQVVRAYNTDRQEVDAAQLKL